MRDLRYIRERTGSRVGAGLALASKAVGLALLVGSSFVLGRAVERRSASVPQPSAAQTRAAASTPASAAPDAAPPLPSVHSATALAPRPSADDAARLARQRAAPAAGVAAGDWPAAGGQLRQDGGGAPVAVALDKQPPTSGEWSLAVGSFRQREEARALALQLRRQGYPAHVFVRGQQLWVVVGRFAAASAAQGLQRRLLRADVSSRPWQLDHRTQLLSGEGLRAP